MLRNITCTLTIVCLTLILFCSMASAAIIRVPSEQPTIQAGIDASVDGDTVLVADGTYTGHGNKNLDYKGKAISVISENGATLTVIDCEFSGRGFYFINNETNYSILEGFSILHGSEGGYPENCGGGIRCENNSNPTVSRCIISGNYGGGIKCQSSSPRISDCVISDNGASETYYGGGMLVENSSPTIINCEIIRNQAQNGGAGLHLSGSSNPIISNCIISDNSALYYCGGINVNNDSNPQLVNCIIQGNSCGKDGGGIQCKTNSTTTITNCTIANNSASWSGGGIMVKDDSFVILSNCIFWDNNPDEIYISSGNLDITYSDIQGGWPGAGNIDTDPLFVDPGNDDYHLHDYSPCIDRGTNEGAPEQDFEGDRRWDHPGIPNDPSVYDMGTDEFIGDNVPPDPFSLLSPSDGDTIEAPSILFDWEDAPDGDGDDVLYEFYLDTDPGFPDPVVFDSLTESEYFHTPELLNFKQYYWKVKAYDGKGGETWSSEVFMFQIWYPEAVIDIEQGEFSFALFIDDAKTDTLLICNTGNIPLDFDISWFEGWLFLEPSAGSVLPDSCMTVEVACSAEELHTGIYLDTLIVTNNSIHDPVITVPVSLEVVTPVLTILECDYPIAPRGGHLEYRAGLANQTDESRIVDVWLDLYLLNGNPYPGNPFLGPMTITMGPYYEAVQERSEYVPYYTPLGGPYEICLRCGQYPTIWDETCFEFTVTPPPVE